MKLLSSPTSPYARKIRILLQELGQEAEIIDVNTKEDPQHLLDANPLAKIPALQTEDGLTLYDSPVIAAYLLSQHDDAAAYLPTDGAAHWLAQTHLARLDGILDACFLRTQENMKPENKQDPFWLGRWSNAINRALDIEETERTPAADALPLTLTDITLVAALGYLDLRHDDLNWRATRPKLSAWFATHASRPSIASTAPNA